MFKNIHKRGEIRRRLATEKENNKNKNPQTKWDSAKAHHFVQLIWSIKWTLAIGDAILTHRCQIFL